MNREGGAESDYDPLPIHREGARGWVTLVLILFLFCFSGCKNDITSSFKIQKRGEKFRDFLEPGARTLVFPLLTHRLAAFTPSMSSRALEEKIRLARPNLPIIPFEEFLQAVADSGQEALFLETMNEFYNKGALTRSSLRRLAGLVRGRDPRFLLIMRIDKVRAYKDASQEHKRQLFVDGKLVALPGGEEALDFVCATLAAGAEKPPSFTDMVEDNTDALARGLPADPARSMVLEKEEEW